MKTKSHRKAKRSHAKRSHAKTILRLPDLEIAKTAVIDSLSCPDAQRGYRHAIDEFVTGIAPSRDCRSAKQW
jgi:hypothetical protein